MFTRLSWHTQFAAGVALFLISFYIEAEVLSAYYRNAPLGFTLAAALEATKAVSIVLYRYFNLTAGIRMPFFVRMLTAVLRIGLVGFSCVCSVMYLGVQLDRPRMEAVRTAAVEAVRTSYAERLHRVESGFEERLSRERSEIRSRFQQLAEATKAQYEPRIQHLERELEKEMDNVVNGVFKGPRYLEWQQRLDTEKAAYRRLLDEYARSEARALSALYAEVEQRRREITTTLSDEHRARMQALSAKDYRGDERVENPLAVAFVAVLNAVAGLEIALLVLAFWFAVCVSTLIELSILVAFESITLAYLPIFEAEHESAIRIGTRRARSKADLADEEIDEILTRGKVARKRRELERRLRKAVRAA